MLVDEFGDGDVTSLRQPMVGSADKHHGLLAQQPHLDACWKPIGC
ncbi:hypothetical protein MBOL_31450 [Mycobacteroides abscessus subsp. bolletii BD]|nr:hypothetical protein MBOL_31450 [Mycobacteroides abscessus subsp. bolletii BD]